MFGIGKFGYAVSISAFWVATSFAQINITVNATEGVKKISPYLYGRNIDKISDTKTESDEEETAAINQMLEAGVHMLRANNGNNATRYNWKRKLTAHPDWYNNVYSHDWDITAKKVLDKMPGIDAMYALQLTGYAAKSTEYNFADWDFQLNHNGTWATATLDLAGGGEASDDGKTLVKAGDYTLYNEEWPADSTVGIIPHWKDELKYDMSRFTYWSMDNEMDIWMGTHSDLPLKVTPDFLVERYVDIAKKARDTWKDIKLTGPVVANEWQWCNVSSYDNNSMGQGSDRKYCWLEYFIMKVAEAQKTSGKRLLDVFDIHWYPAETDYESRMNWHRVLFDTTYNYPGANGIKLVNGSWDNKQTKEYIFKRANEWLNKYFGEGHGITLAITETSLIDEDPMVTALTYASFIGTMQDNGVEIFTPWSWGNGMYEVLHLFSRYGHEYRVESASTNDSLVSAYSSINSAGDSLTVILVNRAENSSQQINMNISNFLATDGDAPTLTLSGISGETFVSHSQNALKKGSVTIQDNKAAISIPAKAIMAIILTTKSVTTVQQPKQTLATKAFHAHTQGNRIIATGFASGSRYFVNDALGHTIKSGFASERLEITVPGAGQYILRIGNTARKVTIK